VLKLGLFQNQHRNSERSEESPFSSIFKRGDPSDLCPQDNKKDKLIKILEQS
jgi:hypothetical protein